MRDEQPQPRPLASPRNKVEGSSHISRIARDIGADLIVAGGRLRA